MRRLSGELLVFRRTKCAGGNRESVKQRQKLLRGDFSAFSLRRFKFLERICRVLEEGISALPRLLRLAHCHDVSRQRGHARHELIGRCRRRREDDRCHAFGARLRCDDEFANHALNACSRSRSVLPSRVFLEERIVVAGRSQVILRAEHLLKRCIEHIVCGRFVRYCEIGIDSQVKCMGAQHAGTCAVNGGNPGRID